MLAVVRDAHARRHHGARTVNLVTSLRGLRGRAPREGPSAPRGAGMLSIRHAAIARARDPRAARRPSPCSGAGLRRPGPPTRTRRRSPRGARGRPWRRSWATTRRTRWGRRRTTACARVVTDALESSLVTTSTPSSKLHVRAHEVRHGGGPARAHSRSRQRQRRGARGALRLGARGTGRLRRRHGRRRRRRGRARAQGGARPAAPGLAPPDGRRRARPPRRGGPGDEPDAHRADGRGRQPSRRAGRAGRASRSRRAPTTRASCGLFRGGHRAPRRREASLFPTLYALLPNDTDLSVYKRKGLAGLNYALIGGAARYHTPRDDLAHADLASLQHQGDDGSSPSCGRSANGKTPRRGGRRSSSSSTASGRSSCGGPREPRPAGGARSALRARLVGGGGREEGAPRAKAGGVGAPRRARGPPRRGRGRGSWPARASAGSAPRRRAGVAAPGAAPRRLPCALGALASGGDGRGAPGAPRAGAAGLWWGTGIALALLGSRDVRAPARSLSSLFVAARRGGVRGHARLGVRARREPLERLQRWAMARDARGRRACRGGGRSRSSTTASGRASSRRSRRARRWWFGRARRRWRRCPRGPCWTAALGLAIGSAAALAVAAVVAPFDAEVPAHVSLRSYATEGEETRTFLFAPGRRPAVARAAVLGAREAVALVARGSPRDPPPPRPRWPRPRQRSRWCPRSPRRLSRGPSVKLRSSRGASGVGARDTPGGRCPRRAHGGRAARASGARPQPRGALVLLRVPHDPARRRDPRTHTRDRSAGRGLRLRSHPGPARGRRAEAEGRARPRCRAVRGGRLRGRGLAASRCSADQGRDRASAASVASFTGVTAPSSV